MKKQKPSAVVKAPTISGAADLKALIRENRIFLDNLVNLIPPKFYIPSEEDSKPWYPGLSKSKKASLKRQTRENLKRARRNRLDPEKKIAQSSTLGLLKESIDKKHEDDSGNEKPLDFGEGDNKENGDGRSVTYEELRQRLRMRIEALRGNRGSGQRSVRKGVADDEDLGESNGKKRKRDEGRGGNSEKNSSNAVDSGNLPSDVEFGKVRIGDDEDGKRRKKKKLPKEKELERLKKLEELKKEKPNVAEKQSWKAAADRAMGVKVHDDPRLLKESMKKEKKRKEKSSGKWKERVETRDKFKEERQQKRRENISGRIHDKKMRKIAKREKKLMRPGFEGRKQEFITEN